MAMIPVTELTYAEKSSLAEIRDLENYVANVKARFAKLVSSHYAHIGEIDREIRRRALLPAEEIEQ